MFNNLKDEEDVMKINTGLLYPSIVLGFLTACGGGGGGGSQPSTQTSTSAVTSVVTTPVVTPAAATVEKPVVVVSTADVVGLAPPSAIKLLQTEG